MSKRRKLSNEAPTTEPNEETIPTMVVKPPPPPAVPLLIDTTEVHGGTDAAAVPASTAAVAPAANAGATGVESHEGVPDACVQFFRGVPSGGKFDPYDYELIEDYLMKKVNDQPLPRHRIADVELYKYHPEKLAGILKDYGREEWYIFTPRDKKYKNGNRPNRAAGDGYWKATGADKSIFGEDDKTVIGFRKTLVFYVGKPPSGSKTEWIMHEYRLNDKTMPGTRNEHGRRQTSFQDPDNMRLDDWVLCKIYKKHDNSRTRHRVRGVRNDESASLVTLEVTNEANETELVAIDFSSFDASDLIFNQPDSESGYESLLAVVEGSGSSHLPIQHTSSNPQDPVNSTSAVAPAAGAGVSRVENHGRAPDAYIQYYRDLPPGWRFRPDDYQLIEDYLMMKVNDQPLPIHRIAEVELYKYHPETLAEIYKDHGEVAWYFFTPRDKKYKNGSRPNRAACNGYWKATGADISVLGDDLETVIGVRKTLVFYVGKPPSGLKTDWIMHEYKLSAKTMPNTRTEHGKRPRSFQDPNNMRLDEWVLCKIYKKHDNSGGRRRVRDNESASSNNGGTEGKVDIHMHMPSSTLESIDETNATDLGSIESQSFNGSGPRFFQQYSESGYESQLAAVEECGGSHLSMQQHTLSNPQDPMTRTSSVMQCFAPGLNNWTGSAAELGNYLVAVPQRVSNIWTDPPPQPPQVPNICTYQPPQVQNNWSLAAAHRQRNRAFSAVPTVQSNRSFCCCSRCCFSTGQL